MLWGSPLRDAVETFANKDHPVWQQISRYFTRDEFFDLYFAMDIEFLRLLYKARSISGVPFRITSAARPKESTVGSRFTAHKKRPCKAVDIKVRNNEERAKIVCACVEIGIRRIGIYPAEEDGSGVLHIDAETSMENPSPRFWTRY